MMTDMMIVYGKDERDNSLIHQTIKKTLKILFYIFAAIVVTFTIASTITGILLKFGVIRGL